MMIRMRQETNIQKKFEGDGGDRDDEGENRKIDRDGDGGNDQVLSLVSFSFSVWLWLGTRVTSNKCTLCTHYDPAKIST